MKVKGRKSNDYKKDKQNETCVQKWKPWVQSLGTKEI